MSISIRDAADDDLPAILEIVNQGIVDSTTSWALEPESADERGHWMAARRARGFPVIVAMDDARGEVVGLASYGDFRDSISKPGYRFCVEHTILIHQNRTGEGIGPILLGELIERARAAGIHVMVAGIDGENEGSIRFHERHGFVETARMPEVGFKYGRWLDLVLMQRTIT
jgi:L-amino acid N-acyltransferase